ncbi:CTP synthase [Plasmodium yoelii 17X]|uniref:CTP synthase n=4 Tax=Plasmodium yoelii TaxID=5861 RepID=A0AAE9WX99_PLAYO|nr:CTP synthase, putative [Plasmodium yoelii]EAA17354.1 CTP synthase [Plasmodium yoelii yoelii]ETB59473.1 CTP synthase [Plasmodium yoelii 17X]WBY58133.1 CTP synthase [Plasmodium yoelii yoelii]CDU85177.1 cytidine triphosphate synthetase, putative [Plasmodium yoelii]VTZ79072.1 CTP synthase, putative [Plasmodium yoelii]|eukprot:XP_725789.1 CTP synthase, putative [Plasmodium yoelii]
METKNPITKYIIVTGGNMSGLGKGTAMSSLGVLLLTKNTLLTTIKIDPYLNVDAGTMSPYEHGEVYVLEDGGEADLDLGNYERFLNIKLTYKNNITSGKIYEQVIKKERKGEYLGKTVQVVPHVTDAIQQWIKDVIDENIKKMIKEYNITDIDQIPCICLIEVGGTVGDIESAVYLEALQQLINNLRSDDVCLCHLSHVPITGNLKEQKTKPTQHSVKILREAGLKPDFIFCRCEQPLNEEAKKKISLFSQVKKEHVISLHDTSNIYKVPLILDQQNFCINVLKKLNLENIVLKNKFYIAPYSFNTWKQLSDRYESSNEIVNIGIVGKYTASNDTYLSIISALVHACIECGFKLVIKYINSSHLSLKNKKKKKSPELKKKMNKYQYDMCLDNNNDANSKQTFIDETTSDEDYDKKWKIKYDNAWNTLKSVDGVLVPGGFGTRGIEGKYLSSQYCRLNNVPYLGICLGMQTSVIDITRQFLNQFASSEEFEDMDEIQYTSGNEQEYKSENNVEQNFTKKDHNDNINDQADQKTNAHILCSEHSQADNKSTSTINKSNINHESNDGKNISCYYNGMPVQKYIDNIPNKLAEDKLQEKIKLMGITDYYKSIEEIDNNNVIISMDGFKGDDKKGGTMRLGVKKSQIIDKDSLIYKSYDEATYIYERHRHRFEINPKYVPLLEAVGLSFVAKDADSVRMEVCEIKHLDFYVGVQFHPEFTSRPFKTNPIFLSFILASKGMLKDRLNKFGNKLCSGKLYEQF